MPVLNWIGKEAVVKHHKEVPFRLLEPVPELSCQVLRPAREQGLNTQLEGYAITNVRASASQAPSDNLIVQGDNLHALKALLPRYAGQVKCIYIDPPYNTGNEGWAYNDNVKSPEIRKWFDSLGRPEIVGKEGETLDRHDRWLCMMYPRLLLLKQFLREDGAIFVSIDDNEVANLRLLMNEMFGTGNFVANILWQKRTSPDARLMISDAHEHIVCYARNSNLLDFKKIPQTAKQLGNYKNPDNDSRGVWASSDYSAQGFRPNQMYSITTPSGRVVNPPPGNCWKNTEDIFLGLVADNRIWFGKEGNGVPRRKTFLSESEGVAAWSWWSNDEVGHSQEAKQEVKDVLADSEIVFDTPKPTRLIQRILQIATDKDSLILDSFAGSGTTGHAVLKQNSVDGGNRKFILVEMDEKIARDVTAERVRRVATGYTKTNGERQEGLGGGFGYYRLSNEPLFEAGGPIRKDVTFAQLAEFVWFMETGSGMQNAKCKMQNEEPGKAETRPVGSVSNAASAFLGTYKDRAVFLLYNGILKDKTDVGGNVLNGRTLEYLKTILPNFDGEMVVYGARSRFDKTKLAKLGITFHQLPYDLAVKTWF